MSRVGIVSCDKWINRLEEDINLRDALNELGIDTEIISWQKPLKKEYDLLLLKSVWGYQNYYDEFKKWLVYLKNNNICLLNDVDMILDNIRKDIQFGILKANDVEIIDTYFLKYNDLLDNSLFDSTSYVVKPSISGSGDNTFLVNNSDVDTNNIIKKEEISRIFKPLLDDNEDCRIMIQPYVDQINDGEYSCIFIDGKLTHTMIRFPSIFHEKKRPYLIREVPDSITKLAYKIEKIPEFNNYLYMRVDMVMVDQKPIIMEVELADPDLLTKYIEDKDKKEEVIKTFAKRIEGRIKR